ncbi:MAG TPA: TlpA disulfide reductase family protein [Thermoanaerobaculia bacterium]|jgi:thiol-disulfide isomerase/thioredoxin|nr:TlpA disulfide reductase family protein [Thermoanaerobaculia bacterium]
MRSTLRLVLLALLLAPWSAAALDFSVKTLDGKPLSSKDLHGKVVLLDFWGTWCQPCVSAVPSLRELSHEMKGEPFVLVSVAVEEDDGPVRSFVKKYQMDWPQVWDPTATFARQSGISRFPTYILLSHDGTVLSTVVGTSRGVERSLRAKVEQAVNAAKTAKTAKKAGPPAGELTR